MRRIPNIKLVLQRRRLDGDFAIQGYSSNRRREACATRSGHFSDFSTDCVSPIRIVVRISAWRNPAQLDVQGNDSFKNQPKRRDTDQNPEQHTLQQGADSNLPQCRP
jgi:hypothetical protein